MRVLPYVSGIVSTEFGLRLGGAVALSALVLASACGGGTPGPEGKGAAPGPGGPPMAMPVETLTLAESPVEQATEFVGTIKSRHTVTVQPQVEGFLRSIAVKSGDRVAAGAKLMEIDAVSQQAGIAAMESTRAARESDAALARLQAQRAKALLDAGAGTAQESEQAAAAQKAADLQVKAIDEQIRQQRNELSYYTVTAPSAGVIGDIPVRQGDRVTRATELTSIDDSAGLELYLNIPVQQAPQLKTGLAVRLLDEAGKPAATERISFVSPSVDDQTQTVLAKAALTDRAHTWRPAQVARAQVVWSTAPSLTIPLTAVMRVNGQYFVFVAENSAQGTVAHMKPVTIGPISGNDYVVLGGLKAGESIIVSGIQKIGDGMPVRAGGPGRQGRS